MKVFAISDLHLSTAVEKPMDIFGDGWQNHFAKISEDWQSKVTDGDLVLLGGDMSWGLTADEAAPDYALVEALNGKNLSYAAITITIGARSAKCAPNSPLSILYKTTPIESKLKAEQAL